MTSLASALSAAEPHTVLVEAEGFEKLGGWVVDQQYMDQMGSPVLLAHGLGVPVEDATTTVTVPAAGTYRVLVRTRDWVAPWKAPGAPGKFQLVVNGHALHTVFGTEGADWHWQEGGTVELTVGKMTLALHDLTGFEGRADAIILTTDSRFVPPNSDPEMARFRRQALGLPAKPGEAGRFDLVVVGGGMAGVCTAISAARLGVTVALIQDRPVLGGNNSSEVRVGLSGRIHQEPYPALGDLVDEIGPIGHHNYADAKRDPENPRSKEVIRIIEANPVKKIHNAGPASNYRDDKKLAACQAEKNLRLFLNMHVYSVEKQGDRITAVIAKNTRTSQESRFAGTLFADCTGDGNLGYLAGADFRVGRESRAETGEPLAPEKPDRLTMGTSVQWYTVDEGRPVPFPDCPWAVQFNEETCQRVTRGDWDWETGMNRDQIDDIEQIRDHAFRVTYGNWSFLKNKSREAAKIANRRLAWMAYVGGKRESRRLLGDVILKQQDLDGRTPYPDACVTTTWSIDLHYPNPENTKHFPGREFRSVARHKRVEPYPIPYRCLYSRNVGNLMMAGRNISVTHVALGTIRVQRTTGMMGEVLGMAASLCKKHGTNPRGVFKEHLDELKQLMRRGVGRKDSAASAGPANRFFAMNYDWYDPKIKSHEVQANLLGELGYQGCQYLGDLEGLPDVIRIMEAREIRVDTAALRGAYNISVDPGATYKPELKQMIRALEGHHTLALIGFSSKKYERSSPEGDAPAVAAAGELADYARQYGVRVAIYPHVNQWCERVEDALRIAEKADRANLGICFNLYHWLKTDHKRDLEKLVAETEPRLFLVTINGTSPEGSMETLDRGSYDVGRFVKTFIDAGYTGPIGLQCCGVRGDARDNLSRSMGAWRAIVAGLTSRQTAR